MAEPRFRGDFRAETPPDVELRGDIPRTIIDVLDAVSAHRRIKRFDLVTEILTAWADDKMAEVTAVARVTGALGNER
jgi:hypothetical protein